MHPSKELLFTRFKINKLNNITVSVRFRCAFSPRIFYINTDYLLHFPHYVCAKLSLKYEPPLILITIYKNRRGNQNFLYTCGNLNCNSINTYKCTRSLGLVYLKNGKIKI